jgi:hypothetical protein
MSLRHTETMIPRARVGEITKERKQIRKGSIRTLSRPGSEEYHTELTAQNCSGFGILNHKVAAAHTRACPSSDSVKRHLPIEYAADLTPVVAAKDARTSWNAPGWQKPLDFSSRKQFGGMASGRTPGKIVRRVEGQAPRRSTGIRGKSDEPVG